MNIHSEIPLKLENDSKLLRKALLNYFENTYLLDDSLYMDLLSGEQSFYKSADSLRHPLIFYFGHTACFYVNKLLNAKLLDKHVNSEFESMFAVGVDEMSWDDLNQDNYDWPSLNDVINYRKKVYEIVKKIICEVPIYDSIKWGNPLWAVLMGIEHQRIHIETSSVLIRQLPLEFVKTSSNWIISEDEKTVPANELIYIKKGKVKQGVNKNNYPFYFWDNELGEKSTFVSSFKTSKYLVSNFEFKEFVDSFGYRNPKFWSKEGWDWKEYKKAEMPLFWRKNRDGFYLRTLVEEIDLPWSWPVEVNFHEAKAFCNWKSQVTGEKYRLPFEEEYCRMREEMDKENVFFGIDANINLRYGASACPINKFLFKDIYDLYGNVWQWTESFIFGFKGFEVHPYYDDFSLPTFDGLHNLMKGGSFISTGNEMLKSSRYAFRRHFYQHCGFRYVQSENIIEQSVDVYETDKIVSQYCESHYGSNDLCLGNFSKNVFSYVLEAIKSDNSFKFNRALDIGCSVGRLSLELSKVFDCVEGIDYSARFIQIAQRFLEKGFMQYYLPIEGDLLNLKRIYLDQLDKEFQPSRVSFYQGDAHNLKHRFKNYDIVFAMNIIDRLRDPSCFLKHIYDRINKGGYFIISSPYTWLEEFTPRENWLGGYRKDGENVLSFSGLKQEFEGKFELVKEPNDFGFLLKESQRKAQYINSQVSIWKKL
ncbi:MAG: 5-histidylcysteine sulfoxide synthase [Bacteroidales bacterium]